MARVSVGTNNIDNGGYCSGQFSMRVLDEKTDGGCRVNPLVDIENAETIVVLGAAYAGEGHVDQVEVSVDDGATWQAAEFIGPDEPFTWRQWQYVWHASQAGEHTIKARATDAQGRRQPETARWNFLGYGNNGVDEHAVRVIVE